MLQRIQSKECNTRSYTDTGINAKIQEMEEVAEIFPKQTGKWALGK
jgi:hypothetical protein